MTDRIDSGEFYAEYHGHPVEHLEQILPRLRESSPGGLIWLAGDSSLDNKYWFRQRRTAIGAYKEILHPPNMKCDVAYWLNRKCEQHNMDMAAINAAVEATTLNERTFRLRPQDKFLRDHIDRDDVLVVSVGGNDVALCPCPCTIASILCLLCLPESSIGSGASFGTVPVDDCCCGCGASLASCLCSCPPCFGYFRHLFGTRVEKYVKKLASKRKPKKVLVCMIYFPSEVTTPSWAGGALAALGYNNNPRKLQALIQRAFVDATSNISIQGSEVIPVGLFNVLNGKNPDDYIARVEPSPTGGSKMADYILHMITQGNAPQPGENGYIMGPTTPPTPSYMGERM